MSPCIGLEAWEARRKQWITPNQTYHNNLEQRKLTLEKGTGTTEGERLALYRQIVFANHPPSEPICLKDMIPILVTGWQDEGVWPKGMVVQDRSD